MEQEGRRRREGTIRKKATKGGVDAAQQKQQRSTDACFFSSAYIGDGLRSSTLPGSCQGQSPNIRRKLADIFRRHHPAIVFGHRDNHGG